MEEKFINKRFGTTAKQLISIVSSVLADYEQQGYDLSLRQLYYQLVSRNVVPNTERSYKNVGNLVSDARLAGLLDWAMITDRGREVRTNPHWDNPSDFITSVAPQYRFDLWANQKVYVEIMVEKQALEGVLLPVCRKYDVSFTANKGYSSSSALYEAGKRLQEQSHKNLVVIYLGDHDPSGIDMTRDVMDRLSLFVGSGVTVRRIALNLDQVRELNPPENPAKVTDSRAAGYIAKFGRSSWELDAVEPRRLVTLVTDAITEVADMALLKRTMEKQRQEREKLIEFAKEF